MIAIKAKELISKVREAAVKVHQSACKQNVKEMRAAMCWKIFSGFLCLRVQ